jgi:hypothetical protein
MKKKIKPRAIIMGDTEPKEMDLPGGIFGQ